MIKKEISQAFNKTCINSQHTNTHTDTYMNIYNSKIKVGDHSREWSEGSLFNSYYIKCVGEDTTPLLVLFQFTLDTYLIMQSVKQEGIKYHFF